MTARRFAPSAIALAACWSGLLAVFIALRLNLSDVQLNIDELIPVKLSEAMSVRGALDPNWRFGDLPWFWNTDQYNFYFYNIVAHGILKLGAWFGATPLPALRLANVAFQLGALAFSIDALRRLGVGVFGLALAGAMLTVAPGLVQDAAMARPESLIYLLVAMQVWLLTLPLPEGRRALLFGLLTGVGSAIKVTYAAAASLIVVAWIASWRARPWRSLVVALIALGAGTAIGFALAAPYALIHSDVMLRGIEMLSRQYNAGQPPHSLPVYTVWHQALWIGRYFFELYGILPLAALAAPFLLKGESRKLAAGFVILCALVFAYFVGKPIFYERNFAQVLIPMLFAATLAVSALGARHWRWAAAAVLLLPMGYWSVQIALALHTRDAVERFEAARALVPSVRLEFDDTIAGKVPAPCETVSLIDYGEPWTTAYRAFLEAQGFQPIAHYRGRFSGLAASTLHTYLDSDMHYFRCPGAKR